MSAYVTAAVMMIASGSIHAVVNALVKGGRDKMAARALTDGASAIILLPALAFVAWPTGAWGWLAASAVAHAVYLYALVRAFQTADLTAAYPVLRGTAPVLTALVTIGWLGEPASATQLLGIALIAGATLALVLGRHIDDAALRWSLLTAACIATYTVIDAHGVRAAPTPYGYIAWLFVMMGTVTPAMFAIASRGAVFDSIGRQWRTGALAGALSIVTYGLALAALAMGPTAPLAALRETGMVTALVIGMVFLRERVTIRRALAVLGIVAGAALILQR
jgi:drug/metabolite transporter (DMT)-like permease